MWNKLLLIIDNLSFFKAASSANSLNGDGGKKRPIPNWEESPNKKMKTRDENKVSSGFVENN